MITSDLTPKRLFDGLLKTTDVKEIQFWGTKTDSEIQGLCLGRYATAQHLQRELVEARLLHQATDCCLYLTSGFMLQLLLIPEVDDNVDKQLFCLYSILTWILRNPCVYVEIKLKRDHKKLSKAAEAIYSASRRLFVEDKVEAVKATRIRLDFWKRHLLERLRSMGVPEYYEDGNTLLNGSISQPNEVSVEEMQRQAQDWRDRGLLLPQHQVFWPFFAQILEIWSDVAQNKGR